ncbi:hypothetical protein [Peribacillus sp. NPDC096540]|uniref:hypothetical protein n=1 Tax=Peribacillus sp. NPDC096540 TaxID=3390612 RepID=UPI003D028DB6
MTKKGHPSNTYTEEMRREVIHLKLEEGCSMSNLETREEAYNFSTIESQTCFTMIM